MRSCNFKKESFARLVAHRALAEASRDIAFLSEFADGQNFLMNLTGCRVLHFTWNGDGDQEKVGSTNYSSVVLVLPYLGCCLGETLPVGGFSCTAVYCRPLGKVC